MAETDFEADLPDKLFFRIGEAASIIGVEAHVLRYWETEFKLRPQRSPSGQRMYRRKDLAKLLRIKQLLHDQGFTIAGARKALVDGSSSAQPDAPAAGGADLARVREAAERIAALRKKVGSARARFSNASRHARTETRSAKSDAPPHIARVLKLPPQARSICGDRRTRWSSSGRSR